MIREFWEGIGREVEYDAREIAEWLDTHPQLVNYVSENLCIILRKVPDAEPGRTYHAALWYRGWEAGSVWSDSLPDLLRRLRARVAAGPSDDEMDG